MDRDAFRTAVFARDRHRCVLCGAPGQDAHHILDRKLFPDGGYALDNGATVCGPCHQKAETTEIGVEAVRDAAGITALHLPPGFAADACYDKWGNRIRPDGTRDRGPLFRDDGARKALGRRLYDGTFGWDPD